MKETQQKKKKSVIPLPLLLALVLVLVLFSFVVSSSLAEDASKTDDEAVHPYKVEISDEGSGFFTFDDHGYLQTSTVLDDLKQRLARTRWPDNLNGLIGLYLFVYHHQSRNFAYPVGYRTMRMKQKTNMPLRQTN